MALKAARAREMYDLTLAEINRKVFRKALGVVLRAFCFKTAADILMLRNDNSDFFKKTGGNSRLFIGVMKARNFIASHILYVFIINQI